MGVEHYTLGRGEMKIQEWDGETYPTDAMVSLGNCPEVAVEITQEDLDHFSSMSGLRTKDKSVVIETGYMLKFVTDEFTTANLARFLKGTIVAATVSDNQYIKANEILDAEFALEFTSDNPAGPNYKWNFWRVKLRPGGEIALISDEWAQMSYEGEGLKATVPVGGADPTTDFFRVEIMDTATG